MTHPSNNGGQRHATLLSRRMAPGWCPGVGVIATFVFATLPSLASSSTWDLDPAATRIAFSVRNLSVAYVDGTFRLASGHVEVDDTDVLRSTVEAVIDAASVDTNE